MSGHLIADDIIDLCAAAAGTSPVMAHVAVGDRPFVISGSPEVMAGCSHFDAFAGHSQPVHGAPVIHVACGEKVAADFPPLPPIDLVRDRRPVMLDEVVIAIRGLPVILYAVSADRTRGAVWFPTPDRRPHYEKVRPLLPVLQAMLRETPWSVLHAASIGCDTRAVLLTGGSRAGKTSLSLAGLAHGWQFFGDDVVAVSVAEPAAPVVARLYDTARLRLPPMPGLEHLTGLGTLSCDDGEHRAELHLSASLLAHPLTARVSDVVHIERTGAAAPAFRRVSRARVISTVTASTLQVTFGDMHHRLAIASVCDALVPRGFDPGPDLVGALHALARRRTVEE